MEYVGLVAKMSWYIKRTYKFPNVSELVKQHIENCLKLIIFSSKNRKSEGLLKSVDKNDISFHTS